WAIGGMLIGIVLYDQLFFRPLLAWADKFRFEEGSSESAPSSWLLTWLRRTERLQPFALRIGALFARSLTLFRRRHDGTTLQRAWDALLAAAVLIALWHLLRFIHTEVGWAEAGHVLVLGSITLLRV